MSYVKLCQIVKQTENNVSYLETDKGVVLVNNPKAFPFTVEVEVIVWPNVNEYNKAGKADAVNFETVTVPDNSVSIRQSVFSQLTGKYPNLVI